ncbi:hypothetical protein V8E55_003197 [Tylopilus felleus]
MFQQAGEIRFLNEAILLLRKALELCPPGHPDFSTLINLLSAVGDLEEAIILNREALELSPPGHRHHSTSLNNLAFCLSTRYDRFGAMRDLEQAILLLREALELCPPRHPDRPSSLINIAKLGDLEEAIILQREALELCPPGHRHHSSSLNNLALYLSTRYDRLGAVGDLEQAIILLREALELCPPGHRHPDRPFSLNNLALCLSARYDQLGAVGDLEEAIIRNREALELYPQGHHHHSTSLNNLAFLGDLEQAIILLREALELCPPGHPCRPFSLINIAKLGDLEEAIILQREALELCPPGHRHHSTSLDNLATCLSMGDLEEAIILHQEALELRPAGHPDRPFSLMNLADCLDTRFTRLEQAEDKVALFSLYLQLVDIDILQMVSSPDLSATRAWIRVAERFQHPSTCLAYETSLRLLVEHLSTLPSLPCHLDLLKKATSSLAVDAFSACLRNRALARAVELLEQGRGVFWSQLTRLRLPLDDVIVSSAAGKRLADEFSRLTSDIRIALNSSDIDQHDRLYHLNSELKRLVIKIRELPGLSHFLLPLPFSDLQHAASGGPVVIVNASQYGCDALVVLLDRDPVHIPLRITQQDVRKLSTDLRTLTIRARKVDVKRDLAVLLRNLWDQIVSPIANFLQTTVPHHSRIWWCPTAEFSLLPLHAASFSDLYVSSYTSTLSALIRARRPGLSNAVNDGTRIVAIGQENAVGESKLFSCVDGLATFTQTQVAKEIGRNQWVHFACHGIPNREKPFESAFALHDGRFTIQRIILCEPQDPQFAYLSACHTTVGDEESPDEVIHLASAMQFAGFR